MTLNVAALFMSVGVPPLIPYLDYAFRLSASAAATNPLKSG